MFPGSIWGSVKSRYPERHEIKQRNLHNLQINISLNIPGRHNSTVYAGWSAPSTRFSVLFIRITVGSECLLTEDDNRSQSYTLDASEASVNRARIK